MEASLNEILLAACQQVLPLEQARLVLEPGEGAVRCKGRDFQCRAPRTIFHRMRGQGEALSYVCPCPALGGLPKSWSFQSPEALALAILEHLEAHDSLADVRATAMGEIAILTKEHLAWRRSQGQLHCKDCGHFFAGQRGLQDHQRQKHNKGVEAALDAVDLSRLAVVPYRPATFPSLAPLALAPEKPKKVPLDPGLCAARDGKLQQLRTLVAEGWSLATRDQHGSNALLWAAGGGHLELCRFLVASNVDPHGHQKDHRNALHWAARNGHMETCRWLVKEPGIDPNKATLDGTTPLHWAVWQSHKAVCDFLIHEAKADLHAKNRYGCNASQWAALAGSVEMCTYLQHQGLDLKVLNFNGHSALHKAAVKGQRLVCEWLLDEGGLGNHQMQPDADGNTPAIMARCGGHLELSRWLQQQSSNGEEKVLLRI